MATHTQIKKLYGLKKDEIIRRLKEFEQVGLIGSDERIFAELAFCILTPQSKAKVCWKCILDICDKGLLLKDNAKQVRKLLTGVRFKNNKAGYIVEAKKFFTDDGKLCIKSMLKQFTASLETREWLVKNINGYGYKEASHFLRNIGLGRELAILDRHILKNLKALGVIDEVPRTLSKKRYLEIERRMTEYSKRIGIPMAHLDLLLWCKETGEVFK